MRNDGRVRGVCRERGSGWNGLGRDGRCRRVVYEQHGRRQLRAARETRRGRGGADDRHDGVRGRGSGGSGHARHHGPQGRGRVLSRHRRGRRDVLDPNPSHGRAERAALQHAQDHHLGPWRGRRRRAPLHADERQRHGRQHVRPHRPRRRRDHQRRQPLGHGRRELPPRPERPHAHAQGRLHHPLQHDHGRHDHALDGHADVPGHGQLPGRHEHDVRHHQRQHPRVLGPAGRPSDPGRRPAQYGPPTGRPTRSSTSARSTTTRPSTSTGRSRATTASATTTIAASS